MRTYLQLERRVYLRQVLHDDARNRRRADHLTSVDNASNRNRKRTCVPCKPDSASDGSGMRPCGVHDLCNQSVTPECYFCTALVPQWPEGDRTRTYPNLIKHAKAYLSRPESACATSDHTPA